MKNYQKSLLDSYTHKKYYNTLEENILHNFLNVYYKYTAVPTKDTVIGDMESRSPFEIAYDHDTDILTINFGDFIRNYKFEWEYRTDSKGFDSYYLNNISIYK